MQLAFNILTRSRRVTHEGLRLRDPEFAAAAEAWFAEHEAARGNGDGQPRPAMFQPLRLRDLELPNRIVVSAMDMYVAQDGVPNDFHLVHLGGKALGGAGLVMTEMVCVSPEGRISPGCCGLWNDEQARGLLAHRRLRAHPVGREDRPAARSLRPQGLDPTDVGRHRPAAARGQLARGRARRRCRTWRASARCRTSSRSTSSTPSPSSSSMRRGAGSRPDSTCSSCTARTATCCRASSRRSPTTAPTSTEGTWRLGCATPCEVFAAMRAVWPADRPMSVRISATDWAEGGHDVDDAVEVARAFAAAGADAVDVSTGQVVSHERPGVRAVVPDAVRRRDPQPHRRRDHRGGRHLVLRRRQLADHGRASRPVRPRPGSPVRPELDAARRRRAGLRGLRRHAGPSRGGPAVASPRPGAPTRRDRGWSWCGRAPRAPGTSAGGLTLDAAADQS